MPPTLNTCLAAVCVTVAAWAGPAHAQTSAGASAPVPQIRLYAVEIRTGPNWDQAKPAHEQAKFREHSANLKKLRDAGHIVIGARYSDKGLLVFSAHAAADVKAMMDQDPSIAAGTFTYDVHDFNVFYPGAVPGRPAR